MISYMSKQKSGSAIGISLILVIFILLCLITFGTLSYMLAERDNEWSQSSADNVEEYYEADIIAQEQLKEIDLILREVYDAVDNQEGYVTTLKNVYEGEESIALLEADDGYYIVFYTDVSDTEVLISTIEICYPADDGYYRIESWILENKNNL